jgi:Amt family ammonium transporter
MVAAVLVGPRMGKYNRDGSANAIPGHSVPLANVGMLLVLAGWLPYVLGFVGTAKAGAAGMNVLLAGAAGCVAAVGLSQVRYFKADIHLAFAGMLGGLVAISAAADVGSGIAAVVIGGVAGIIVPMAMVMLDLVWKVDDPTGGIVVHGVGAAWGILAAGLFAGTGSMGARIGLLGVQVLGLVVIAGLAAVVSGGVLWGLKRTVGLRSKEADEFDGLDLAEHDIGSYPDFQQTMIKSYHLREA